MFATHFEAIPRAESNSVRGIAQSIRARSTKSAADDNSVRARNATFARGMWCSGANHHTEMGHEIDPNTRRSIRARNQDSVRGPISFRARTRARKGARDRASSSTTFPRTKLEFRARTQNQFRARNQYSMRGNGVVNYPITETVITFEP